MRRRARGQPHRFAPGGERFIDDNRAFGDCVGERMGNRDRVQRAGGHRRFRQLLKRWRFTACAQGIDQHRQPGETIFIACHQFVHLAADRLELARAARIGEERHRFRRFHRDDVLEPCKKRHRQRHRIGNAFKRHPPCPAFDPRREKLRGDPAAGFASDLPGKIERRPARCLVAEDDQNRLTRTEHARNRVDPARIGCARRGGNPGLTHQFAGITPTDVTRQNQRGNLRRMLIGPGHGRCRIARNGVRSISAPHPVAQRAGKPLDIRDQRRIEFKVTVRVIANDVDHPRSRPLGVVDIRQAIRQPRPEMQQR